MFSSEPVSGREEEPAINDDGASAPSVEAFRAELAAWLVKNRPEIAAHRGEPRARTLKSELAHAQWLFGVLWDEGFTRWGWPPACGGRSGSPLLRAVVSEQIALGGLAHSAPWGMPEVLGPAFVAAASPELVTQFVEPYLNGTEWWCQGFSEPGAGSDLAHLSTSAVQQGDVFVINGQKLWTTMAHFAQRCVLVVRTGTPESGSRGLTVLFVDMDSPGITVRPLRTMAGDEDFCEVFFDDVEVPLDRVVGAVDGGWSVVGHILMCERSTSFWGRVAWMYERFDGLLNAGPAGGHLGLLGSVYELLVSVRARSRATQYATASGRFSAAASSIDKALVASTEQALFDAASHILDESIFFGSRDDEEDWRTEYLYSMAATIYGGTSEIQRNIIAEKLIGLPRG
jgi:alkylation response protein AidB-like acyl-CoA dehydrogenase